MSCLQKAYNSDTIFTCTMLC